MGFLQSLLWLISATVPCGRVLGIPVRVHVLIAIMVPLLALPFLTSGLPWWLGVLLAAIYVGLLYGSVLAHELGHAWGCRLVGGETDQILLTPIGGIHMGTGGLESPRSELIVVALGPAVSVVLAVAFTLLAWGVSPMLAGRGVAGYVLGMSIYMAASINTTLALFNLLFPLFPMDCARLIRAGASLRMNANKVTYNLCRFGIGFAVVMMVLGILNIRVPLLPSFGPMMFLVGIMGIQACLHELERIKYMGVYTKSDTWGARTVYYDADLVRGARSRAWGDLGGLVRLRWIGGLFRRRTARVVPIHTPTLSSRVLDAAPLPRSGDVDSMTDLRALEELQRRAVAREDYELAARVKGRIRELLK